MVNLEYFKIQKLHGYKNYRINFKDNILILVGENGSGKTTILRMLFYFLSGQWSALAKFKFHSLSLKIENNLYTVKHADLVGPFDFRNRRLLHHIPLHIRHKFLRILDEFGDTNLPLSELERLCDLYNIPFHLILRELDFVHEESRSRQIEQLKKVSKEIQAAFRGIQLLYLPTYRRIEQELSSIFKGIDEDELRHRKHLVKRTTKINYTELIEFGMRDVSRSIQDTLVSLKEFARERLNSLTLAYLGDVVDEKYTEVDVDQIRQASDEMIANIINRIDPNILSEESKKTSIKNNR